MFPNLFGATQHNLYLKNSTDVSPNKNVTKTIKYNDLLLTPCKTFLVEHSGRHTLWSSSTTLNLAPF